MYQNNKEMLEEIQKKREKMIASAKVNGFTSEDTIRYSQELDQLIYQYQCTFRSEIRKGGEIMVGFKQMMLVWPKEVVRI